MPRHNLRDQKIPPIPQGSTIRTDSRKLTWLDRFKGTRDKLTRWALLLQEFSFKVEHCPRKQNELADNLSRNPVEEIHDFLQDQD